ncbi:hypothetical protein [Planctomicrobium piriforme]|uniref:hypothetical protein n=1 Tax=Planctomicrobium piriforme TaxID=1576369 RepID=UPI001113319F|nr:hypothetical protein [Planctomicrobium piriforme]
MRFVSTGENDSFSRNEQALLTAQDEQDLRAEINKFTERFFAMDTAERRQAHAELLRRTHGYPALQAHLKRLAAGLSLTAASFPAAGEDERQLVKFAMRSFVCWPAEAARMRQAFSRSLNEDRHWNNVARRLSERVPQFAALIPELLPVIEWDVWDAVRKSAANNPSFRPSQFFELPPWWGVLIAVGAVAFAFLISAEPDPGFWIQGRFSQRKSPTGYSIEDFTTEYDREQIRKLNTPGSPEGEALRKIIHGTQTIPAEKNAKESKANRSRIPAKPTPLRSLD